MLKAGERSQNQKQQRRMTLTTKQTGQKRWAQLKNSTTTLVACASEISERVRKKSTTLRMGEGEGRRELSQTQLNVLLNSSAKIKRVSQNSIEKNLSVAYVHILHATFFHAQNAAAAGAVAAGAAVCSRQDAVSRVLVER